MYGFWGNVWFTEKYMGSVELVGSEEMYGFRKKCKGSGEINGFWKNVWFLEKCMGSGEM